MLLGDGIASWLACLINDCEAGVRVLLAAGGPVATVGQLGDLRKRKPQLIIDHESASENANS